MFIRVYTNQWFTLLASANVWKMTQNFTHKQWKSFDGVQMFCWKEFGPRAAIFLPLLYTIYCTNMHAWKCIVAKHQAKVFMVQHRDHSFL